ncbi:MAG: 2'-5' RNA ligase family protein [Candidatus Andersenbacteria bacterium]
MKQYSIDVVLLPPPEITAWGIELNKTLQVPGKQKIVLDAEACLPHISLFMGCVSQDSLSQVQNILREIASSAQVLPLTSAESYVATLPTKEQVTMLRITTTPALQSLHERIVQALTPLSEVATLDSLCTPPPVSEITLTWVNGFIKHSSYQHFSPHITLGLGELPTPVTTSRSFGATTLALCHLGSYCTCRAVLWETTLVE